MKLFIASILVLTFCVAAFAQTNETSSCPTINMASPAGSVQTNKSTVYTVSVDSKGKELKLEYVWFFTAAEIFKGQGTNSITVKHPEGSSTITVKVKGFPEGCPNTNSQTLYICPSPAAVKIDECLNPVSKIENRKSEKLIKALSEDPTARLFVLVGHKEKSLSKIQMEKGREILELLIKESEIYLNRITLIRVLSDKETVQFWIVPKGALLPKL